jgi:hypothetical protein
MKTHKQLASGLAAAALALACSAPRTQAQTIITNTYTFTFPTTGPSEGPFSDTTWIYWYNQNPGYSSILTDPTTDASNPVAGANTSDSGSLMVISPLDESENEQNVFFGCFADSGSYNFSVQANTLLYSSVSFDILVASNTPLSTSSNYGGIQVGFISSGYSDEVITAGNVTIPASASTSWYHVSVPIDQTQQFGNVPGICLGINSFGGYPKFTITNWIDNISINGSVAPPPPPPTMIGPQTPVTGLNLIDTTPTAADDRYQIADTNDAAGGLSFVGQSSVTYSFTIKSFPTNDPSYGYQAHFFIVSGPDGTNSTTEYPGPYDQAADYNLANCIFVTIQSDGNGGGVCNFRYKTNEPGNSSIGGNAMIFNTVSPTNTAVNSNGWPIMPVAALDSAPILGTWSLNFANTTNVTITSPSGATTNFSIDPASAALFADPATLILGAQPNNAGYTGLQQEVVYSSFSLTGTPAAFTDNFLTDASLNTTNWENLANDPNGVVLVPASAAFWVGWTLPAPNYALVGESNLAGGSGWANVTPITTIKDGAQEESLVGTNALPGGSAGYFAVVQRKFSQLLVLLPGETNAPNTPTGKIGTPDPFSLSASGGLLTFTVLAVDAKWNPIPGINDTLMFSDNDSGEYLAPFALVNGTGQFTGFFQNTASNVAITAMDVTTPTITPNTSTAFTVGP